MAASGPPFFWLSDAGVSRVRCGKYEHAKRAGGIILLPQAVFHELEGMSLALMFGTAAARMPTQTGSTCR
jgi:hypothetical protein